MKGKSLIAQFEDLCARVRLMHDNFKSNNTRLKHSQVAALRTTSEQFRNAATGLCEAVLSVTEVPMIKGPTS